MSEDVARADRNPEKGIGDLEQPQHQPSSLDALVETEKLNRRRKGEHH
jgi:hypothetical protein